MYSQVGAKRWKVNIGSSHEAALMLSAVNLPGSVQRRRTAVDELNMRNVFVEGDLITVSEGQNQFMWHGLWTVYPIVSGACALKLKNKSSFRITLISPKS